MENKSFKELLDNDSEVDENDIVNWTTKSDDEEVNDEESDESSDDGSDTDDFEEILNNNIKNISNQKEEPEINIEVIKKNNEKCVQVTINMQLENKTNDIINLDFIINKEIFLKIAKQLKQ